MSLPNIHIVGVSGQGPAQMELMGILGAIEIAVSTKAKGIGIPIKDADIEQVEKMMSQTSFTYKIVDGTLDVDLTKLKRGE